MANQKDITLRQGAAQPKDIVLYELPVVGIFAGTPIYLYQGEAVSKNIVLRNPQQAPETGTVNYTLTCAAGAYTYTGQAAGITVARRLSLEAGAYTYQGNAASLTVAHNLQLAVGAYSYVGNAATLALRRLLALDTGAYVYTGNAATLTYAPGGVDYTLVCDAGAYAYTGQDATLTYTQGVVNYDTHDGADTEKLDKKFRKEKEKLREMLDNAFNAVHGITLPKEIQENAERAPERVEGLTANDLSEIKAEINLLMAQLYMQAAIQKAAAQDEDDVETLMLLNG